MTTRDGGAGLPALRRRLAERRHVEIFDLLELLGRQVEAPLDEVDGSRPAGFDGFRERGEAVLEPRRDSAQLLSLAGNLLDNFVGVTSGVTATVAVLQT